MKNASKMKSILRIVGIIAILAVVGLTITACSNDLTGSYLNPGTYGYDEGLGYRNTSITITLRSNGTYSTYSGRNGSYSTYGSTLQLDQNFYGYNWTIVNSSTLRDGSGYTWRRR